VYCRGCIECNSRTPTIQARVSIKRLALKLRYFMAFLVDRDRFRVFVGVPTIGVLISSTDNKRLQKAVCLPISLAVIPYPDILFLRHKPALHLFIGCSLFLLSNQVWPVVGVFLVPKLAPLISKKRSRRLPLTTCFVCRFRLYLYLFD